MQSPHKFMNDVAKGYLAARSKKDNKKESAPKEKAPKEQSDKKEFPKKK